MNLYDLRQGMRSAFVWLLHCQGSTHAAEDAFEVTLFVLAHPPWLDRLYVCRLWQLCYSMLLFAQQADTE
jgi:hypothetical protein